MLSVLNGPWLLCAALVLVAVAAWRTPRPSVGELRLIGAMSGCALVGRLVWGVWGPLHVNGQGPLWIRGALTPDALAAYGPGYFELFNWVTRLGFPPDRAVFAANAVLSALSPAVLYAAARLAGVERGGALAVALVLAADAVTVHTAASEAYFTSMIVLVLGVQASLALALQSEVRGDRLASALALGAAGLLAAAAARIHAMAYLPLALSPLVVFGAAQPERWLTRARRAAVAAATIGATVVLTSGSTIITALRESPMASHAISGLAPLHWGLGLGSLVALWVFRRWVRLHWLPLLSIFSLMLMLATQDSFQEHPLQKLCYQRLFWPGVLLGLAALWPPRMQGRGWAFGSAGAVAIGLFMSARPYLGVPTTEQLEYHFLQETLGDLPPGCTIASVNRAGERLWDIPSYLVPSSGGRGVGAQRAVTSPSDLDIAVGPGDCVAYVRASLCTSAQARELCESVERQTRLERVASRLFPAVPSYFDLPYDRAEVEVVVFRLTGHGAGTKSAQAAVSDGAAITPAFAQSLYDRLAAVPAADGCQVAQFDTSRFRIAIGLQPPSGAVYTLELATTQDGGSAKRRAGNWALAVPPELDRDCAATVGAIERILLETSAPIAVRSSADILKKANTSYGLIALSFVLLVLWTIRILLRELRAQRPSSYAVAALLLVWGVALALRLWLSPRTFLHEYYHVAETVSAYLMGEIAPAYGKTGPALFRLLGSALGRPYDVQVVFLTNAVIASLAIPAIALLALALTRSWPHALCVAVLLCVLPLHLRFSAAEDLFVLAVTFGLWALGLFVLYVRTRRLEDALVSALALSVAMQTRPEMLFFPAVLVTLVLLVEPRSWRVLFAWPTLLALGVLGVLLIPRAFELQRALSEAPSPTATLPAIGYYFRSLVFLQCQVTPMAYWVLVAIGTAWGVRRKPGLVLWVLSVFFGYTLFSLSLFGNPPYNLRSQLLPTCLLMLIAGGTASLWMEWGNRNQQRACTLGACVLAGFAAVVVVTWRGFATELRDQQLEWAFLERTVPQLPKQATLLSAVEIGGNNLDAFPEFLLARSNMTYQMVDLRRAAKGDGGWPPPSENLIYYQGMFCYFAFQDEPSPEPMTAPCTAVHQRYALEPLFIEDLHTEGYSLLRYAPGPYRIGFFRLKAAR